jgi:hypothetical protein
VLNRPSRRDFGRVRERTRQQIEIERRNRNDAEQAGKGIADGKVEADADDRPGLCYSPEKSPSHSLREPG